MRSRVGSVGVGDDHACGKAAAQVVQDVTAQAFAGDDGRYAGRVGVICSAATRPTASLGAYELGTAKEGITRQDDTVQ